MQSSLVTYILGGLIFGWQFTAVPKGNYNEIATFVHPLISLIFKFLSNLIMIWTSVTLCFSVSIFLHSSLISIGISLGIQVFSNTISMYLENFSWFKYTFFSNLDLSLYLGNLNSKINGLSIEQSIIKLVMYLTIITTTTFLFFKKKEF